MNHYLLGADFDGTVANTFRPSPNNIGVHEAYAMSVEAIFGSEGMEAYEAIGGLQNRAPEELIEELLAQTQRERLLANAKEFFSGGQAQIEGRTPSGKIASLKWEDENPERVIAELLVRQKLSYLVKEIGTKFPDGTTWPEPCEGFVEFYENTSELNQSTEEFRLHMGILSSGHQEFIEKTFRLWELEPPRLMVTDDDIRHRMYPKEKSMRVKPSVFLFALLHQRWMREQGQVVHEFDWEGAQAMKERVTFIGDDPNKDGELARQSKVMFGLYENGTENLVNDSETTFRFGNWKVISDTLMRPEIQVELREGRSFERIWSSWQKKELRDTDFKEKRR